MAFLDLVSELCGVLPGLSPPLAEKHINRAWDEIRSARNWAFLVTDGVLICPVQVTDGSAAITQYQSTVTLDAAASAALLPQTLPGAVPGILTLQIRFFPSSLFPGSGQIYSILAVDTLNPAALVLTLDRMVVEPTDPASAYQSYRAYVTPPAHDFLSWLSVVDMTNAFRLRLDSSSAAFDGRDPQRMAQGLAYWIGSWGGNLTVNPVTGATSPSAIQDAATPIYELWPHPTSGQTFYVRFRRRGEAFAQPTDMPPPGISEGLILQRALGWHSYQWAMANVAHYPTFKGTNWPQLITAARSYYQTELLAAKRQDDEQQLQTVWNRGHGLRTGRAFDFKGISDFPIDASYMQQHLIRF